MSLSGHVHHFALVISIYDLVIFIDAPLHFELAGLEDQRLPCSADSVGVLVQRRRLQHAGLWTNSALPVSPAQSGGGSDKEPDAIDQALSGDTSGRLACRCEAGTYARPQVVEEAASQTRAAQDDSEQAQQRRGALDTAETRWREVSKPTQQTERTTHPEPFPAHAP